MACVSFWKFPLCPAEPISNGSEDGHATVQLERLVISLIYVMTYLRRKSKQRTVSFSRGGKVLPLGHPGTVHGNALLPTPFWRGPR